MANQFTRREVNRALLASALSLAAARIIPAPATPATTLFDFAIAGGWYHGLDQVRDTLAYGEHLVLRPEPQNPHDANAIAVHRTRGLMLGYIPREANEPIARLLERGARIDAVIVEMPHIIRAADIPDNLAFTGFSDGDPRIRLIHRGRLA
jgi:hypothetical protein